MPNKIKRNCKCQECNLINARRYFEQRLREHKSLVSGSPNLAELTSTSISLCIFRKINFMEY